MNLSLKGFDAMRQCVGGDIAEVLEDLVRTASDTQLNRINPLRFADEHALDPARTIAAFLHATRCGLFELSWNVICSTCGGVLHASASLRGVDQQHYTCALCASDCQPTLDETVEVTFTVDPRVRRIASHNPDTLPLWAYARQCFWSSGSDLPDDLEPFVKDAVLDAADIEPHGRVLRTVALKSGTAVLFDPVTHSARVLDITGPDGVEQQRVAIAIDAFDRSMTPIRISPGILSMSLENRTSRRVLPILWAVGPELKDIVSRRIPMLTASRLLAQQTFRDLYGTHVLDVNQRFRITRLTFLFTDLKESTKLYDRLGDLAAYDFVRAYFLLAQKIVADHGGAVVKTIGDAVMAAFPTPVQSVQAAIAMNGALADLNSKRDDRAQFVRIGIHSGPCLAVLMNDRQDYFGQTVNIASRLQNIAADRILVTEAVAEDEHVRRYIVQNRLPLESFRATLRGIEGDIALFAIPL